MGSEIIQFSRFSTKESLIDCLAASNVGTVCHYHVPLDPVHTILAQTCLTVLLQLDCKTAWNVFSTRRSHISQRGPGYMIWMNRASRSKDDLAEHTRPTPSRATALLYYAALRDFNGLAKRFIIIHVKDALYCWNMKQDMNVWNLDNVASSVATWATGGSRFTSGPPALYDADVNARGWNRTPLYCASRYTQVVQLPLG
jgi:hypothetical protein